MSVPPPHRSDLLGLPPPEVLDGYEKIAPGFIAFVQAELKAHREAQQISETRAYEARMYRCQTERLIATRGQIFGLAIGIVAIVSGTVAAICHAQVAGSFIGAGGVLGLVSVFIIQSRLSPEAHNRSVLKPAGDPTTEPSPT